MYIIAFSQININRLHGSYTGWNCAKSCYSNPAIRTPAVYIYHKNTAIRNLQLHNPPEKDAAL